MSALATYFIATALLASTPADPKPRVVLIPTMNESGEKWEDLKKKQNDKVDSFLREEFTRRGFEVVVKDDVTSAIKKLNIDFTDDEQLKRATMFSLGKELNADYFYIPVIVSTEQATQKRDLYDDKEGRTSVKAWFLDVKNEKPIFSAKTFNGRSGGNRITLRPSDRQIQAAANAVRDSLADFFKGFPVSK